MPAEQSASALALEGRANGTKVVILGAGVAGMCAAYELGKVGDQTLAEMVFSLKQLEFGLDKHNSLPSECRSCPYLKLCWGECPRTRILKTREGEGNLSYLCRGWKKSSKIPDSR